jgi:pyruvate dehydrogenase E2 component (dihydrolipoamide acetyltransferase)
MKIELHLPELGENITSADVTRVLVREGDTIAVGRSVLEVETEKAVVEIPSSQAGKVVNVHVSKGQAIKVGQLLLTLETEVGEKQSMITPQVAPATTPTNAPTSNSVKALEDWAAMTVPVPAGPEARRLARELSVNLTQVHGTGPHGRITVEDVRAAAAGGTAKVAPPVSVATPAPIPAAASPIESVSAVMPPSVSGSSPSLNTQESAVPPGELSQDAYGPVRCERMSRIRRTIATQMVKSATVIPHVTNFDDADVTELEQIRKSVPQSFVGPSVKLTAMAFVMKAVALSLRQHPLLNATLDEENETIVYKQYVHLGVAVDTPRGLVVPVLRNVDQMSVIQVARELTTLAARARSAEFKLEDLRGGTFTVSNLGAVGGTYSTPIINHPEVAILLIGRSRGQLGMHDGKIESRLMLPLSLSFDHRVVDGAAAGRFLNDVIDYLQTPGKLLLTT